MENETTQDNKASILADVWLNYRSDGEFADFVEYNDLGLPLAYAIANKIVSPSPMSLSFINESFSLLLAGLGVEDQGFETIDDILDSEGTE